MSESNTVDNIIANQRLGQLQGLANDANELTIQQEAHLLHILHVRALKDQLNIEAAQLRERQEKIKYLHETMQELHNCMDSKGNLDISKQPGVIENLQHIREMGVKLPESTKVEFSSHEAKRLLDNLNFAIEDWEKEDSTQMRKIHSLYTESEQSILIVKNTMASMDKPIRGMIAGIKGG
jgi:hypothetical protein